jgi:tetratricopeptide (TPR) repeat protein
MQDIAQLVQHSNAISIINFDGCVLDPEAFYPLAEAAKSPTVIHLRADIPLERDAAMALAESIIENDKLGIVLGRPQDYVLLGHALEIKGYTSEAIVYYQQGLDLNKHPDLDDMMRAKLFYRQGKAHILNSDSEQAIECWKKALKYEPDSVPTLLYLSRFLIESGDPHTAKKYAAKAVELQPTNERAKEYFEAASEPLSPQKTLKKALLDN